jgi:predicted helicase
MNHIVNKENLALCIGRAGHVIDPGEWNIVFCASYPTDLNLYRRGGNNVFPLFLYPDPEKNGDFFSNGSARHANLNPKFIREVSAKLKLKFLDDGKGDLKNTYGPEDIFNYIYAIFHSPTYRARYAEFLKGDFPRVPLTSNFKLFGKLCAKGSDLVALHLLESPDLLNFITSYPMPGDNQIEKGFPKYSKGRVYINKDDRETGNQGQYFEGVPEEIWNFYIGGYQVCEKWLKDRAKAGRKLSYDDIQHYQKIVVALRETIRLMAEIDQLIPEWPLK